jgi:pentapeptide MXKDX repeat protein
VLGAASFAAMHNYCEAGGKQSGPTCSPEPRTVRQKPVTPKNFSARGVTNGIVGPLWRERHSSLSKPASKESPTMTISTRIALGASVAALSLSLALAPAAFAQDAMKKDDGMMKKDTMSKKDTMKKDTMKKDDAMTKDSMKKDDSMKK